MQSVESSLKNAIHSLRGNQQASGFSELTLFLKQFYKASQEGIIVGDPTRFNLIFQEILVAQAKGEHEALADILEFQLSPLLA